MRTKRLALLLLLLLLLPVAQTQAFSGDQPPTSAELLAESEIIVIARVAELIGVRDGVGAGNTSFFNLRVESYIRPAAPGPDTLVLETVGGFSLWAAMDGPLSSQPVRGRALYFLRRSGGMTTHAKGPFTPTLSLNETRFVPGVWPSHQQELVPLLSAPRYPAYPKPVVRVNGRQIGTAILKEGRSYLPAALLNAALGLALPDEGLLPVRAVAETKGAQVLWKADEWAVEITYAITPKEPALLSQAQAVERLVAHEQAIMDEWQSGRLFAEVYTVGEARLDRAWIDPITGAERPVWKVHVGPLGMMVLVDAVTGEVLYQGRP